MFDKNKLTEKIITHFGGLASYLDKSGDYFFNVGLENIIKVGFDVRIEAQDCYTIVGGEKNNVTIRLTYDNVKLTPPKFIFNGVEIDMLPSHAIQRKTTYGAKLTVSAIIRIYSGAIEDKNIIKKEVVDNLDIGIIPIMCNGVLCNARKIPCELWDDLKIPFECMSGGIQIVEGNMYSMLVKKEMMPGRFYTFIEAIKNGDPSIKYKYNLRGDIITSSNTDNVKTTYIVLKANTNKGDLPSLDIGWKIPYFESVEKLPFYVMYKLMGVMTDVDMIKYIVSGYETKTDKAIIQILNQIMTAETPERKMLHGKLDIVSFWKNLHQYLKDNQKVEAQTHKSIHIDKLELSHVLENVNNRFLSQHGTTEADLEKKRIVYGKLIREMLIKYIMLRNVKDEATAKKIAETDRVDIGNCSFTLPHDLYKLMFIKAFNKNYVSLSRNILEGALMNETNIENIKKFDYASVLKKNAHVNSKEFKTFSSFVRQSAIRINDKNSNKRENRISQLIDSSKGGYNILEKKSSFIAFPSYIESTNTDNLRKPPPSGFGFACMISTAESDPGKRQGIALTASIIIPMLKKDEAVIYETLSKHEHLTLLEKLVENYRNFEAYYSVYYNNALLGVTKNPIALRRSLIDSRRKNLISRETSIFINNDNMSVNVNTISGRGYSYLFIVYNNYADYIAGKDKEFKQWINYDEKKYENKPFQSLLDDQVLEAVFTDENIDIYACVSQTVFKDNINNIKNQYSHLELESNLISLTTSNIPFLSYGPGQRFTFGGCHQLGAADKARPDISGKKKDMVLTTMYETLLNNISNKVAYPNGVISYALVAPHVNAQEDGLAASRFASKFGYMSCRFYNNGTYTLTSGRSIKTPNPNDTSNMKPDFNYGKLGADGIIPEGTCITKGDVLVNIVRSNAGDKTGILYTDEAVAYEGPNTGIVTHVAKSIIDNKNDTNSNIIINVVKDMPIKLGDKTAIINGCKSTISSLEENYNMLSNEYGTSPQLLIDPYAIVARDLYNATLIQFLSLLSIIDGIAYDSTGFNSSSDLYRLDEISAKITQYMGNKEGATMMYSNKTGLAVGYMIMLPLDHLVIQKKSEVALYSVGDARVDPNTQQPFSGRHGGSHKMSEMDRQAFSSYGMTKLTKDFESDRIEEAWCIKCNDLSIYNIREKKYFCKSCKSQDDIYHIGSTFAVKGVTS